MEIDVTYEVEGQAYLGIVIAVVPKPSGAVKLLVIKQDGKFELMDYTEVVAL